MQGFAAEHDLDVRPHVKTHKCVEVGRRQLEAGAVGSTTGNVGEAEVFAAAGSRSAGSTPAVAFSTSSVITEIRPGEYVFCDLNNTRLGACEEDQIALFVAATAD